MKHRSEEVRETETQSNVGNPERETVGSDRAVLQPIEPKEREP